MMTDAPRQPTRGADFRPHPVFWNRLPKEDQVEFARLRTQLHQYQKSYGKDPRVVTFRKELNAVLNFIERDEAHREERSILTGIAFAGPFICVNTRLLKQFLGRCKSSINGGFQQMGYVAIRTKTKARNCIVAVMHSLTSEPSLLRQWTVRGASPNAEICFVSSFPMNLLPEVTQSDLNLDNHTNTSVLQSTALRNVARPNSTVPPIASLDQKPKFAIYQPSKFIPESYSVESLSAFDDTEWNILPEQEQDSSWEINDLSIGGIPRSVSTSMDFCGDWLRITNDWAA
ncbi:hypothetical protein GPJ56_005858 [Histomonas meleagridis]|uniref:uncharacterized protein n=1 Tax=Histomonas meleagridis TaxID=135588 RepID=UPI00355A7A2C|nr:hypothetical protein GPJ56_005858 [Histomonas meleagridis]KAH0798607.1 hypothetical protein GO595_008472 [Histomonas meleagridis]